MRLETSRKKGSVATMSAFVTVLLASGIISGFQNIDKEIMICIFCLIAANIMILKLSKIYVLTAKGKEEYKKAYMLKKYLVEYSLIEQRDLDGLVIFDDYLIYATAFWIQNIITSRVSEKLLNLNIKLQVISKILTL